MRRRATLSLIAVPGIALALTGCSIVQSLTGSHVTVYEHIGTMPHEPMVAEDELVLRWEEPGRVLFIARAGRGACDTEPGPIEFADTTATITFEETDLDGCAATPSMWGWRVTFPEDVPPDVKVSVHNFPEMGDVQSYDLRA